MTIEEAIMLAASLHQGQKRNGEPAIFGALRLMLKAHHHGQNLDTQIVELIRGVPYVTDEELLELGVPQSALLLAAHPE